MISVSPKVVKFVYDVVYAAAGTPTAIFPIEPKALVQATSGRVTDLAKPQ